MALQSHGKAVVCPSIRVFQKQPWRYANGLCSIRLVWAESQAAWPNGAKYKEWFDCSVPHGTTAHLEKATDVLQEFVNNIVEQERAEFLEAALQVYRVETAKSEKGFWRGVAEALVAALIWSILLIVAAIIIKWIGIDIVEVFGRVAGQATD